MSNSSTIEERLTAIWATLFDRADIGLEDSFFNLGGNSLMAIQLAKKIYQSENVRISLIALLDNPTIAEQAKAIQLYKDNPDKIQQEINPS